MTRRHLRTLWHHPRRDTAIAWGLVIAALVIVGGAGVLWWAL